MDRTNKFHWLTGQITDRCLPDLQPAFDKTQIRGEAPPLCKLRDDRWQGDYFQKGDGATLLDDCFDVHLELHLSNDNHVSFKLHLESNPYMPGLNKKVEIPEEQRKQLWELRKRFAQSLKADRNKLEVAGWRLDAFPDWGTPPPRTHNQLAKFSRDFDPSGTVGEFREWMRKVAQSISPSIKRVGEEIGLWK